MKPYSPRAEVLWKVDPLVEACRRHPAWGHFHKECGKLSLHFDHIEKQKDTRQYRAVAFTTQKLRSGTYQFLEVAVGHGKAPMDAVIDAYQAAGERWTNDETHMWAQRLRDPKWSPVAQVAVEISEFDDILGGDAEPDFEDILG